MLLPHTTQLRKAVHPLRGEATTRALTPSFIS